MFNFLGNYKFPFGVGVRFRKRVTGPINTTPSAWLDLPAMVAASGPAVLSLVPASVSRRRAATWKSPVIPWQVHAERLGVLREWSHYTITGSVYNFTNQRNWQPSPSIYGNDFLVLNDPRTFEIRLQAKF